MSVPATIQRYLDQIQLPDPESHKGQNGKLLIIGGSDLFHAASKWSLDVASKIVDMVFYSSVPINNDLIKEAKGQFWNGIVVPRAALTDYMDEADAILIGPGMERDQVTAELTNQLITEHRHKKWIIDAGALQMIDPALFAASHIITPHRVELQRLVSKQPEPELDLTKLSHTSTGEWQTLYQALNQATMVLKGPVDYVMGEVGPIQIEGGNAGMTKGGTGDVLAGLIAALYCRHDALTAAVVGSYVNKKAGEALYQRVGPYFNASDLVEVVPETLWRLLRGQRLV